MEERRRRQRLPWIAMQAQVKIRKGLMSAHWVDVDVVDYTSLGMGVRHVEGLKVDDRIQLNLKLSTETGDITAERIPAKVCHEKSTEQGLVLGIDFGEKVSESARQSLLRIEGIMERHQQLARRLG